MAISRRSTRRVSRRTARKTTKSMKVKKTGGKLSLNPLKWFAKSKKTTKARRSHKSRK